MPFWLPLEDVICLGTGGSYFISVISLYVDVDNSNNFIIIYWIQVFCQFHKKVIFKLSYKWGLLQGLRGQAYLWKIVTLPFAFVALWHIIAPVFNKEIFFFLKYVCANHSTINLCDSRFSSLTAIKNKMQEMCSYIQCWAHAGKQER